MALQFTTSCLEDATSLFRYYKNLGDRAMAQLDEAHFTAVLDPEMNSVALIVKHMHGNMRSRWLGFPEADGEKPDRDRDAEFAAPPPTRAEVLKLWEAGWDYVFAALGRLTDADLARETKIRGEAHSVTQAVHRQLAHYAYHVGQIVFLAKHFRSDAWKSLTIPRKGSADFNQRVASGEASQR
jgi:uncharacterized protein DUF1572